MADANHPSSQTAGTDAPTPGGSHGAHLNAASGNAGMGNLGYGPQEFPTWPANNSNHLFSTGRNLKEWLKEQFCDHPIEHCEDTRLHDAAYVGDLQTIRSLLQEESFQSRINEKSVWCCGWLPCTPLRIAATAGHGNCVEFLIRKGAEIDLVDVKGQTALYVAVVHGHLECAQILLEAGADPNGSRHHRSTPVYHAARVGRADILRELIKYGADVDVTHHVTSGVPIPSSRPLTSLVVCPLYISAAYHNLPCFRLLLQAGANPDFNSWGPVNIQGFSRGSAVCVMDAVLRHGCDVAFVSLLIDFGANLNLVKWETLGEGATGRIRVNPEALQVFREARSGPRSLMSLCRVAVRRGLGKGRLQLIHTLPVPDPITKFLLHEQQFCHGSESQQQECVKSDRKTNHMASLELLTYECNFEQLPRGSHYEQSTLQIITAFSKRSLEPGGPEIYRYTLKFLGDGAYHSVITTQEF